jgi:hypothetical protein
MIQFSHDDNDDDDDLSVFQCWILIDKQLINS